MKHGGNFSPNYRYKASQLHLHWKSNRFVVFVFAAWGAANFSSWTQSCALAACCGTAPSYFPNRRVWPPRCGILWKKDMSSINAWNTRMWQLIIFCTYSAGTIEAKAQNIICTTARDLGREKSKRRIVAFHSTCLRPCSGKHYVRGKAGMLAAQTPAIWIEIGNCLCQ